MKDPFHGLIYIKKTERRIDCLIHVLALLLIISEAMLAKVLPYLRVIPVIATYYVIEKNVISASNADGVSM